MELRHLRCFVAVAEELHFTRAAERLHIEQSPLSRAIKELEDDLGAQLFERNRRGTRLTQAGVVFLEDVRRLFAMLAQARENVKAISAGYRGSLHIAVSDGVVDPRLSSLLARCRAEEPDVEIRLTEVPLAEQLRGLRAGGFDIGLAHAADVGEGIIAEPIWQDPIVLAIPTHHPLLVLKEVPLDELVRYPLVMCDPQVCEGYCREVMCLLRALDREPTIAEYVSSADMMLTLVGAGYGVAFASAARVAVCHHPNVVVRPLAVADAILTTYLLRSDNATPAMSLDRFVARLHAHLAE